jgi:hypothetical protein
LQAVVPLGPLSPRVELPFPFPIDDVALLCKPDHRMVHESGWTIHMVNGYPEFIPPKWLDPDQTPRRNHAPHSGGEKHIEA